MIFVTVGTHEQPFDRLLKWVDKLRGEKVIKENVIMQTGFSAYEPCYCQWKRMLPYEEMVKTMENARIVITHGGPASFLMPLQMGKVPIVVPRQRKYGEHVNDHQVVFTEAVVKRQNNIILVKEMDKLGDVILQYDKITKTMSKKMSRNNMNFNIRLKKIVDEMYR